MLRRQRIALSEIPIQQMKNPGMLMNTEQISQFVFAGRAIFTLSNEATGNRFTFRVRANKMDPRNRYFLDVLTGPSNTSSYMYIGHYNRRRGEIGLKELGKTSPTISQQTIRWFLNKLRQGASLPENVVFQHAGHCGRCGRLLTVPESIASGIGPECSKYV
jgi:hypothetical protein